MKKTILSGLSILLMSVAFVGCSNEVSVDENYAYKKKVMEYDAAFEQEFGKIAPGHQWGFDDTAGARTRGEAMPGKDKKDEKYDCGYVLPSDITSKKEGNWGNERRDEFIKGNGVDINELVLYKDFVFSYYWLQHVNKAEGEHQKMKKFEAYDSTTGSWIEVTNFENGDNTANTYYVKKTKLKGTTLMLGMGGAGDPDNDYKLFRWKDGNGNDHYDYKFLEYKGQLFLGLKYDKTHWWVILIVQATPKTPEEEVLEEGRIFCEDMGQIGDFDFNDVVFDAKIDYTGKIEIEILAAGGTLPITVAGQAVTLGEMTNTGVNVVEGTQKITVDAATAKTNKWFTIKDIPVVVNPGGDAAPYELGAGENGAPQKFCTYINASWADEYVNIKKAYPEFDEWVQSQHPSKWVDTENEIYTDRILSNNN